MAQVATYLNFERQTEEVFTFYKTVFGTEFMSDIARFGDVPTSDEYPGPSEEYKNLFMNVALPITGGHVLMGTDAPETMGFKLNPGNNVYICLMPDDRADSDRLFAALSEGGEVEMPMADMFWGDYWGSFTDKYGIRWMINCSSKD
ncbi:MAG TPA: VOC family protein [Thermomicrobiales bacterium]|nr:VOC family protein [Thermomicrobiales bacterium]